MTFDALRGKTADAAMALYWYDTLSDKIGGTLHLTPQTVGDEWAYVQYVATSPEGAVGFWYDLEGLFANDNFIDDGTGTMIVNPAGGGIYYDDASMVPEPVTLSLLGLGVLMLRRRRKA